MPSTPMAGLGFKPQHADEALQATATGLWFEVHPENYLVDGGPRAALLEALAERFPLSFHGVSLSLAGAAPPDIAHLTRLRRLIDRIKPVRMSEHLAWSSRGGHYVPDLLPFPRTEEALLRVVDNVGRTQDALGCQVSLENPSHYLAIEGHAYSETDFLAELVRRSGCGLLLDINNVHVSAHNLGIDARAYIASYPMHAVTEIHVAGHRPDADDPRLLIDSHDAPVSTPVWSLYAEALLRTGPVPTLIERDGAVPSFASLMAERSVAQALLDAGREVLCDA
ncbi:DUF692 domain-containing protein [Luteibacter pinisoli]|uniref:DUF692 domain-containing protein n=1 Tax=Luteibacter pinisoli TaxID=2589080 RepID=A0A4Y5Z3R7_9GAMM|nr:DUF692 domain-containing protein [Luteibacter pinisoli]QDE39777.1 DUF692 domain-containing protein [Luteibacter pinisoli]